MRAQRAEIPVRGYGVYDIYTVPRTMIDVHRSYVPFWLHGVAGADLRPDIMIDEQLVD